MLYNKYLKKNHKCPFCHLIKQEVIKQNKCGILTLARAPYTKDHLLIIPKKHVLKLNKLSKMQKDAIESLIYYGLKKLHKKYKNVTILYREGNKKEVGKSINHVHYHLIPNLKIGAIDQNKANKRKFLSEKKYIEKTNEFKKKLI
jgi:diadenosine tetraphosphate (Ap4A) HIT family hydrolase